MPEGSHWEIVVPSKLGYGERGVGSDITPNATLLYDYEFVSIKPKQ
jgi:FKBP-type peptidyl-prolyl cis-trans isomerase